MGTVLGHLFIDPTTLPGGSNYHPQGCNDPSWAPFQDDVGAAYGFIQLLSLLAAYAYVLFIASNMIADGSELLLLIPSLAGIVGSVVLPVLGAVPDGAIVLFSGLGPDAQNQLAVGMGGLAGSTVMLLTLPWILSVYAGRVEVENGKANYAKRPRTNKFSLFHTGVTCNAQIKTNAYWMLATAASFIIIQGPAFSYDKNGKDDTAELNREGNGEKWWSFAGMLLCIIMFCAYLWDQVKQANTERLQAIKQKALSAGLRDLPIDIKGVVRIKLEENEKARLSKGSGRSRPLLDSTSSVFSVTDDEDIDELKELLKPFFKIYDYSGDGKMQKDEIKLLFKDLGHNLSGQGLQEMFDIGDANHDGEIDFDEFVDMMVHFVQTEDHHLETRKHRSRSESEILGGADEEEEEEEMPEEWADLDHTAQKRAILTAAFKQMGLGTILVLLFSDPIVDVFSEIGTRTHIPPFYISFVLAPLASNASELIASYSYAGKKTQKSITIALSALEGAACMNNTFCLGIFLALVFFKDLAWKFTAETLSCLLVQVAMFVVAMRPTQTMFMACAVCSLYPLCLVFVAVLENVAGLD